MKNLKNAAYFLSLVSFQAFGMNGPLALASLILDAAKPASAQAAIVGKKSAEQLRKEKTAYEKLSEANAKVAEIQQRKVSICLAVAKIVEDMHEGSVFDFSGYDKAVSVQEKRRELSTVRLEEIEINKKYEDAVYEWQKTLDEYNLVKDGLKTTNALMPYEPPTFIPAKIIQGSTAAVLHNSK